MSPRLLMAGVIAGMFAAAPVAHGAVIAQYDFQASNTTPNIINTNATVAIAFGTSTRGLSGANPTPGFTNDFWTPKPTITISRSDNTLNQFYVDVTLTAKPGFELNMDSFSFDGGAGGGASGDRTYEVHSNVAGIARNADISPAPPTSLASGGFTVIRGATGTTKAMQNVPVDLSSTAYDHVTSLEMRVYFNTLTINQNIDLDNITFNGAVNALPAGPTATYTSTGPQTLGAVTVNGSAAAGYVLANKPESAVTSGTLEVDGTLSTSADRTLVYLDLAGGLTAAQSIATSLGAFASPGEITIGGITYDLLLTFNTNPTGSPDFFTFDFSSVTGGGVNNIAVVPEPATAIAALALPGLFILRRRRSTI